MATQARTPLGSLPGDVNNRIFPRVDIPASGLVTIARSMDKENVPVKSASGKPASKKRKSTEDHAPAPVVDVDQINLFGEVIDKDCDQVRRLIRRVLDSKAMTKTAFAREIGVGLQSLNGFLGTSGPDKGAGFAAYGAAWEYFKRRELAGLKFPSPKKQKTGAASSIASTAKPKRASKQQAAEVVDLSDIVLDGEEYDDVPVFDTCDEVRRKIDVYLRRPGVTQASLCRAIYAQLKGPDRPDKPFQGAQLSRFRNLKGPRAGARSPLFYGAYVFFEKLRIKEGKPKTKHRLEMEQIWSWEGGFPRDFDQRQSIICPVGKTPYIDKYGVLY